jgi:hypothetical protein
MASTETLVVKESFVGSLDGGKTDSMFREGEAISADHPAVKKWPEHFRAHHLVHEVEQATAAPGERRR